MPDLNEATTPKQRIDPQLERAGWDLSDPDQVRFEIPVDGFDPAAWQTLQATLEQIREQEGLYQLDLPAGVCDYALYRENGEILTVVEAKRTSIDPRLAQPQAEFYVTEIAKRQGRPPFAFMTNGLDTYTRKPHWAENYLNVRLQPPLNSLRLHSLQSKAIIAS